MIKKILLLPVVVGLFLISNTEVIAASKNPSDDCTPNVDICVPEDTYSCQYVKPPAKTWLCKKIAVPAGDDCVRGVNTCPTGYDCKLDKNLNPPKYLCMKSAPAGGNGIGKIFGKITPPDSIINFGGKDATGAKGISTFLSNLISLIYIFASIALLFMLLWGAFDWITSEGEKEKVNSARNKIINAIIGLILFSVAFAFLRILGTFTGFEFFKQEQCCPTGWVEQNYRCVFLDDQNRVLYSQPTSCTK